MQKNSSGSMVIVDSSSLGFSTSQKVAGLPVHVRLYRQLKKAGYSSIFMKESNPGAISSYYNKEWKTEFLAFESSEVDCPIFNGSGLYKLNDIVSFKAGEVSEISPVMIAKNDEDLAEMQKYLWKDLRKPIENDGVVAYFLSRPVSRIFSHILINFPVTPNHATLISAFMAFTGALAVAFPGFLILGAILYWFSNVFDCVDGEIARLKVEGSVFGQWLDTIVDDLATIAFSVGLGFAVSTYSPGLAILMWISAGLYAISSILVYRVLNRIGVIDTAQYPYFFLGDKGSASREKGPFTYISYLFRRDVILFIHLVFGVTAFLKGMYYMQVSINLGMAGITFLDQFVRIFKKNHT